MAEHTAPAERAAHSTEARPAPAHSQAAPDLEPVLGSRNGVSPLLDRPGPRSAALVMRLQGALGNQAVARLLHQAGQRVSRQVDASVAGEALHPGATTDPGLMPDAREKGLDGGQPLEPSIRTREEARLGMDLSTVRLHQDEQSAHAAETHLARALTFRDHIFAARSVPSLQTE